MSGKIKVFVIDDSALARQVLVQFLSNDPSIEVVGTASDPLMALDRLEKAWPDVLTLDVEMPRMDGLAFLEKLMVTRPTPVVMVSSLTEVGCQTALRALELGAVDFVTKPRIDIAEKLPEVMGEVIEKIKAASQAKVQPPLKRDVPARLSADAVIAKKGVTPMLETTEKVVVIGASTGGTEALAAILQALPADSPGICVVQHMPEKFTKVFADRLNGLCKVGVKEAANGDSVLKGHVLIAPGNFHMCLKRSGARYYVNVLEGPLVNRHRPSVDVLFRSAAQSAGKNALGIILTGMGDDGARGMKELRDAGAMTVAQDEASCVVFGMPREAIRLNAVKKVSPLSEIPALIGGLGKKTAHASFITQEV